MVCNEIVWYLFVSIHIMWRILGLCQIFSEMDVKAITYVAILVQG